MSKSIQRSYNANFVFPKIDKQEKSLQMNLIELKLKFCVQSLFKSSDSSLVLDIWTLEVKSPFYLLRFWDWTEDVLSQGKQSLMSPKFLTRRMPPFSLMIAIPTL